MSDAIFAELSAEVERESAYLIALLQRLVRIPSVNPKFERAEGLNRETDVQDVIEAELATLSRNWRVDQRMGG